MPVTPTPPILVEPVIPGYPPVSVPAPVPAPDAAKNILFDVATVNWGIDILLNLCIRVTIGGVTVNIWFTRLVRADGGAKRFSVLLPLGASIQEATSTYELVEY